MPAVHVRIPNGMVKRLERLTTYLSWRLASRDEEDKPATRSDSIRECVAVGLEQLERDRMSDMASGRYRPRSE